MGFMAFVEGNLGCVRVQGNIGQLVRTDAMESKK